MDPYANDGPSPAAPAPPPSGTGRRAWIAATALAAGALLVRLIGLDHTPHIDELYHVLAGESLLRDGSLRLSADGAVYARARPFTMLVAGSMALFGDSLAAARLPAAVAGALLVGAMFLSVRRYGNPLAAWLAAGLVALAPTDLYLSQQVRFYTLHALLIWGAAIALFALAAGGARGSGRRAAALALGAAGGLAAAYSLQMSTALAAAALLVAAAPVAAWTYRERLRRPQARTWLAVLALAAAALAWLTLGGFGERLLRTWRAPGSVTIGRDEGARFYFDYFARLLGVLWAALPALTAAALARRTRFAGFLGIYVLLAFLGVSFSTWRHERYLYFALPAVYALVGMGVSAGYAWLRSAWERALREGGRAPASARRRANALAAASTVLAAAFAAPTVDAASYSYRMLTVSDAEWWLGGHFRGEADWGRAVRSVEALGLPAGATVASSPQKATYFLGDLDYILLARAVPRADGGFDEPSIDRQWSRPEVASPEAVEAIMACHAAGVILVERREWRRAQGVPDATADRIEARASPLPVPSDTRVLAFAWGPGDGPAAPPDGWACTAAGAATRRG